MAPEGSTIKSHGSLLLSAMTQRSLHRAQYLGENAANTPSICTLVTFRLHCNHHRDSLGLSFGEWRLAISLYPFLSSPASEHLSGSLRKHHCSSLRQTSFSRKLQCFRSRSARSCPKFTRTLFLPVKQQNVGYFHSLLQNSDEGFILHLHNSN